MRSRGECHPFECNFLLPLAKTEGNTGIITDMSFSELAFLFLLGLIMFGPKKLPELSRQLGRILGELRRASQEFQAQLGDEVRKLDNEHDITNTIGNFQVTGTTARDRILNAVLDAGNTLKSSFEDKPATTTPPEQPEQPAVATPQQSAPDQQSTSEPL